jgi:hypothetical protein
MKNLFKLSYLALALSVLSCTDDLNTIPKDDDQFLSDELLNGYVKVEHII